MILGINHVQITVPKGGESQAREFYCNLLGLVEIEKPTPLKANGGFWLKAGSLQVHIGVEDNPYRNETKAHIAFEVKSIEIMRELLQSNGVSVKENTPIKGFERFDIRDPFGNRIEIMQRINR